MFLNDGSSKKLHKMFYKKSCRKVLQKKIDKKIHKTDFPRFLLFAFCFGRFSVRGAPKRHKNLSYPKNTKKQIGPWALVLFWPLTCLCLYPPTRDPRGTGGPRLFWGRPLLALAPCSLVLAAWLGCCCARREVRRPVVCYFTILSETAAAPSPLWKEGGI
jgi:hypothetical protein